MSSNSHELSALDGDTVEYAFKVKVEADSHWLLTGVIDRIDRGRDGVPEIVDFKSGNPSDEETVRRSLQLKIYSRVAMNKYQKRNGASLSSFPSNGNDRHRDMVERRCPCL
jgi:RecB family exonuclease